ncbi:hypothetical protein HNY73_004569 [Argiope bruennichi]|uniref:Uncharacterized protein n=1 Tax=Argiope bruennichi TaxID=94029 RepID=A0A8T0FU34_ARGBR|nr:hypothetical protein HNY73_004569 [Argiope bruennichi]
MKSKRVSLGSTYPCKGRIDRSPENATIAYTPLPSNQVPPRMVKLMIKTEYSCMISIEMPIQFFQSIFCTLLKISFGNDF